jgi:glutamyl-tRNA synthetase/glutamyl-Q tRNA(Asp) synthetase
MTGIPRERFRLTRFAPAPTGLLHLGHVVNAIHVWGLAARHGAEVLLRIEDHDRQRSRPEYEAGVLDDLDWLGFRADRFPTAAFRAGVCDSRQSDRDAVYRQTTRDLHARGLVYGCTCSRQRLGPARPADRALTCRGQCRDRGLPLDDGMAWRVRIDAGTEAFDDLLLGAKSQTPDRDLGDVAIRDRHGNWTYQFAVTVDDLLQHVDLVVRGRDLLPSTGLQIRLARLIGRPTPPRFAHHPLLMKSATEKLSKSDGDTGIADLRAAGMAPGEVIGRAAWQIGLVDAPRPMEATDVGSLFS